MVAQNRLIKEQKRVERVEKNQDPEGEAMRKKE